MKTNPSISPVETINKLGKAKERKDLPNHVTYLIFSTPMADTNCVAYYKDDKLALYGYDDNYFHLMAAYKLGLITKEDYRWNYQMLQQEDLAQRQMALQVFGLWQDRKYQRESLNNQEEMINLQKQPSYHSGTIYDYKTGKTYQYEGQSQKRENVIYARD